MEYEFSTLIDVGKTQALLTSFARAVGIPSASIIDLHGKVLVGGSWGIFCRDFHHKHPQCHAKCLVSDAYITNQLSQKREIYCYQCPNGLADAASPIFIEGEHVANFFAGQFLLAPPDVEFFRRQAAEYAFDEQAYLNTLATVPVIPKEKLSPILDCLVTFAQILGEIGLHRIRELKTIEELRATERRFEDLLNFLQQIVWSTYEDGSEVLHTPAAAEQIYGRPAEDFLCNGHLREDIVHPDDLEKFRRAGAIVRESGAYEFDFRIVRPDGTIRWLNNRGRLVRDSTGKPIRTDGIATDITARKQEEEEKRQLEMQLQHAQKLESLGVMAGGIAHDFNNLLTVIRGNADLLAEQLSLEPEQETALHNIRTAASYASSMTRALQTFSRPTRPEFRTVDVNVLVRDTYNLLRPVLPAMIEFKTRFDPGSCTIDADPAQIQQVLVNLCVNARDAMAGGGKLTIETRLVPADDLPSHTRPIRASDRYLRLRVSDTGCGMDAETAKSMFDPFFTTKPKDLGTGLGLAIVYRIIMAHQGIIDVASRPREGTRIDLFFPTAEPTKVDTWIGPSPEAGRRGRILVVDDEEMIASLLQTVLESMGHTVFVANRAEDAIELARSADKPLDLAVIDYYLPRQTGIECLDIIRKWHPDLKAIIISGHGINGEQIQQPDTRLLSKPFSTRTLMQAVQNDLESEPGSPEIPAS